MPSKSDKQHRLMAMVANDPKAAKRLNIPQSVGEEFMKADKGKKFAKGGDAKLSKLFKGKDTYGEELKEAKAIKSGKITPREYAKGEGMEEAKKMKCGGSIKKMASGGAVNVGGKSLPKAKDMGSMGMKAGGLAKANGKAVRGKTKGRFV